MADMLKAAIAVLALAGAPWGCADGGEPAGRGGTGGAVAIGTGGAPATGGQSGGTAAGGAREATGGTGTGGSATGGTAGSSQTGGHAGAAAATGGTGTGGKLADCTSIYRSPSAQPAPGEGTGCDVPASNGGLRVAQMNGYICIQYCRDASGNVIDQTCTSNTADPGATVACVTDCGGCK